MSVTSVFTLALRSAVFIPGEGDFLLFTLSLAGDILPSLFGETLADFEFLGFGEVFRVLLELILSSILSNSSSEALAGLVFLGLGEICLFLLELILASILSNSSSSSFPSLSEAYFGTECFFFSTLLVFDLGVSGSTLTLLPTCGNAKSSSLSSSITGLLLQLEIQHFRRTDRTLMGDNCLQKFFYLVNSTVNVLKFRTLFSFCSQLNVGYQSWNSQNAFQRSKQGKLRSDCFFRSSLI